MPGKLFHDPSTDPHEVERMVRVKGASHARTARDEDGRPSLRVHPRRNEREPLGQHL